MDILKLVRSEIKELGDKREARLCRKLAAMLVAYAETLEAPQQAAADSQKPPVPPDHEN